jgi:hypothetical protein
MTGPSTLSSRELRAGRRNPITRSSRSKPVTASALRIELVMQPNVSAGVQEWKVK